MSRKRQGEASTEYRRRGFKFSQDYKNHLAAKLNRRMSRKARRSHHSGIELADITETDHCGRNSAQHLLQEASQEEIGIDGEAEGKTNYVRKVKQSAHSPTARTEQAEEIVRIVVLSRFPRNLIVTVQELGGALCLKNMTDTGETDMEEKKK